MSILTSRDLKFLASLRICWQTLYWSEVARLLKEDDPCADLSKTPTPDRQLQPSNSFMGVTNGQSNLTPLWN